MKYLDLKQYLFPIFITSLGLLTAYVFYILWHSEEVNPPQISKYSKQKKVIENLSDKNIIPKNILVVSEVSLSNYDTTEEDESMMFTLIEKDTPIFTPQQIETQTQNTYEALTPDDHEETMQESEEAFAVLDDYVEELDVKISQEMKIH